MHFHSHCPSSYAVLLSLRHTKFCLHLLLAVSAVITKGWCRPTCAHTNASKCAISKSSLTVLSIAIVGANVLKTGRFGEFSTVWMCGQGLHNSTVGIVGLGRIGLAVAKRLVPFGVARIIYTSRQPKDIDDVQAEFVSMDTLLTDSDFIVVCCSLTPETMGLFDRAKFARMKRNAIFVNVSRGSVVVQPDLEEALRSGQCLLK